MLLIPRSSIRCDFFIGKSTAHFVQHAVLFGQLRVSGDGSTGSHGAASLRELASQGTTSTGQERHGEPGTICLWGNAGTLGKIVIFANNNENAMKNSMLGCWHFQRKLCRTKEKSVTTQRYFTIQVMAPVTRPLCPFMRRLRLAS
jgi:hypothetical protein